MKAKLGLILLFLTCFYIKAQKITSENDIDGSLETYLNVLQNTSSQDSLYQKTVDHYLQKAKKESNSEHLFQAYIYKIAIEQNIKHMHQYADSLFILNNKHPNITNEIKALQTKSTVYYVEKNYPKMLEYELRALKLINKNQSPYEYYKSIYSIGQVYFYMQQYADAKDNFKDARNYFSAFEDYNNQRGYFNSIRYEALCEYYLQNYQKSYKLIQKALNEVAILKHYANFERGYLELVLGMNLYQQKQYNKSLEQLKTALPTIQKNEDYANESVIYYYTGLNYTAVNNIPESIEYFKKVDLLFQQRDYINFEVLPAYNYLVEYYKDENNTEQQLYYTNRQLLASVHLQKSYKSLSSTLHKKLDIEGLQAEKERLEKNLQQKNNRLFVILCIAIPGFLISLYFWIYNNKKKKEYHKQYKASEQQREIDRQTRINLKTVEDDNKKKTIPTKVTKSRSVIVNKDIEQMILNELQKFEEQHLYLESNLDILKLAKRWNTNRTYLSNCINKHKGKTFLDYINSLRINYFMEMIEKNKHWKSYKIKAIAEELGFSGGRNFSDVFIKQMGFPPSYYIQQKEKEK